MKSILVYLFVLFVALSNAARVHGVDYHDQVHVVDNNDHVQVADNDHVQVADNDHVHVVDNNDHVQTADNNDQVQVVDNNEQVQVADNNDHVQVADNSDHVQVADNTDQVQVVDNNHGGHGHDDLNVDAQYYQPSFPIVEDSAFYRPTYGNNPNGGYEQISGPGPALVDQPYPYKQYAFAGARDGKK